MVALAVKDLVELVLWLLILLTARGTIHSTDSIIRLALARRIPLVAWPSTVVMTLSIVVVVTTWEAAPLLLLFVCPTLHHIAELFYNFGAVTPKVTVKGLDSNATPEVVDDIFVRDVGDGSSCVEEVLDVGSDGFALLLLAH